MFDNFNFIFFCSEMHDVNASCLEITKSQNCWLLFRLTNIAGSPIWSPQIVEAIIIPIEMLTIFCQRSPNRNPPPSSVACVKIQVNPWLRCSWPSITNSFDNFVAGKFANLWCTILDPAKYVSPSWPQWNVKLVKLDILCTSSNSSSSSSM